MFFYSILRRSAVRQLVGPCLCAIPQARSLVARGSLSSRCPGDGRESPSARTLNQKVESATHPRNGPVQPRHPSAAIQHKLFDCNGLYIRYAAGNPVGACVARFGLGN